MISIGDFARLGRVSVRMLRHYDTIGEQLTGEQLRAMLRLRQAELQAEILDGRHRLDRVQARLRLIDAEDTMTHPDMITKAIPAAAVVGLTATAASATQEDVGPVVGPMYPVIMQLLAAAGAAPAGVDAAYQLLHAWVRDHGFTDAGRAREVYLECPDDASEWITEIQVEFARR